jgi:hypothetical protein
MPDLINKIRTLLTEYGLTEKEADERARNICQAVSAALDTGMSWHWAEVALMLAPTPKHLYGSIDDPVARNQAASEACRIVIAERYGTVFGAWVALQRHVRDTPEVAYRWLQEHGYAPAISDFDVDAAVMPASGLRLRGQSL